MAEPFYDNVTILLPFDEADGATSFSNAGTLSLTATASGGAVGDDQNLKFGNNVHFPTAGQVTIATQPEFDLSDRPFTIEAWIRIEADSALDNDGNRTAQICGTWGDGTAALTGYNFFIEGDGTTTGTGLSFGTYNVSPNLRRISGAFSFSKNVWYHVAYVREGDGTEFLFVDGTSISFSVITAGTGYSIANDFDNAFTVGQSNVTIYPMALLGRIDDLRVTRNVARYTANFTAPVTAFDTQLPADTDYAAVVSLLHFDEPVGSPGTVTCQKGVVWTLDGAGVSVGYRNGLFGNSGTNAINITGNNSCLRRPAYNLGNSEFTIEFAFLHTATGTQVADRIFHTAGENLAAIGFTTETTTTFNTRFQVRNSAGTLRVDAVNLFATALNTWYQVAISREVDDIVVHINGVEIGRYALNPGEALLDDAGAGRNWVLGGNESASPNRSIRGFIDEFRYTAGVARYA